MTYCISDYESQQYEQILAVARFDQLLVAEPNPQANWICFIYEESDANLYTWGVVINDKWCKMQLVAVGKATKPVLEHPTMVIYS